MQNDKMSRRTALARACRFTAAMGALAFVGSCAKNDNATACVNPSQLSGPQRSMRVSLSYTDRAPDPAKACRGCAYFQPADSADCGSCQILNGPVTAGGNCTSWDAKA